MERLPLIDLFKAMEAGDIDAAKDAYQKVPDNMRALLTGKSIFGETVEVGKEWEAQP